MDVELVKALAKAGGYAAVALAAVGSATGAGIAGQAAIAAWKRCYAQNKPAPFLLVAMAGAPLSQTIYGMILMMLLNGGNGNGIFYMLMGIFSIALKLTIHAIKITKDFTAIQKSHLASRPIACPAVGTTSKNDNPPHFKMPKRFS